MQIKLQGVNSYLELMESGRALGEKPSAEGTQELRNALQSLLCHAHETRELPTESAWRLAAPVCRALERRHESTPPGGWARLAALAAGCGLLKADASSFLPAATPELIASLEQSQLHRGLCEAFTRRLVPPASAAGLFIMLGIHPAWALWVSHHAHFRSRGCILKYNKTGDNNDDSYINGKSTKNISPCDDTNHHQNKHDSQNNHDPQNNHNPQNLNTAAPCPDISPQASPGWRDTSVFDPKIAQQLEHCVFSAIACLIAALRQLEPTRCYPMDAFSTLTRSSCDFARRQARQTLQSIPNAGLLPFLPDEFYAHHGVAAEEPGVCQRSRDFTAMDLFDAVFVPAGLARRFDDDSFCVNPNALTLVQVGSLDPAGQAQMLTRMLSSQVGVPVA